MPVITPKLPPSTLDDGLAKFGWFVALKASQRNCSFILSPTFQFFMIDASMPKNPGPK